jgi:hypothetical protein
MKGLPLYHHEFAYSFNVSIGIALVRVRKYIN